jgi:hypothetical protein
MPIEYVPSEAWRNVDENARDVGDLEGAKIRYGYGAHVARQLMDALRAEQTPQHSDTRRQRFLGCMMGRQALDHDVRTPAFTFDHEGMKGQFVLGEYAALWVNANPFKPYITDHYYYLRQPNTDGTMSVNRKPLEPGDLQLRPPVIGITTPGLSEGYSVKVAQFVSALEAVSVSVDVPLR